VRNRFKLFYRVSSRRVSPPALASFSFPAWSSIRLINCSAWRKLSSTAIASGGPAIFVAIFFYFTARDENAIDKLSPHPDVTVEVVGFQWDWQFNYLSSADDKTALDRYNRSYEYDGLGDNYARLPDWKPRTQRLKGYPY